MPLFFIIAIGAGAMTVGAVTADIASDGRFHGANDSSHTAQAAPAQGGFQASAYPTLQDCLNAAAGRGVPASACQQS